MEHLAICNPIQESYYHHDVINLWSASRQIVCVTAGFWLSTAFVAHDLFQSKMISVHDITFLHI
jgi:hypothetical protein